MFFDTPEFRDCWLEKMHRFAQTPKLEKYFAPGCHTLNDVGPLKIRYSKTAEIGL